MDRGRSGNWRDRRRRTERMTGPVTTSGCDRRHARNTELIRQWEILREVDGARHGVSVAKLASVHGVHQRTIRRDLEALCRAGFPLYDDEVNATRMWKLREKPFKRLKAASGSSNCACSI